MAKLLDDKMRAVQDREVRVATQTNTMNKYKLDLEGKQKKADETEFKLKTE